MNAKDRAIVADAINTLNEVMTKLTTVQEAEQQAYNQLSEDDAEGKKGEVMQANIDALTEAIDYVTDVVAALESIEV